MLKIAVVTRYFPNSAQPWQGRSAYQILRLLSRKANVRVFFPNAMYPLGLKPRSRTYDHLDPSYSPPDVKVTYHDYPALPLLSRPVNDCMAARALLPHVRSFAPDIIHSFFLYPEGSAALKIGEALSIPAVVNAIGSDINRIGDPISALNTRFVLRKADFVFTVSEDLRRKAVTMGASPARSRTLLNGCDLSVFHAADRLVARNRLHIDLTSQAVVYIGRIDIKKGLRELTEAAVALHPQRPHVQVYMVGEGPDRADIQNLICSNNATGYIHAMPPCSFEEVAVWMTAADVVTLPSYMEGCPNVVLEALACGRPVVATNVGGIPEIMSDDYGQLVPPRDTPALARAIAAVLDRTWDAETISAHCSRSWSDVAAELLEVIESLVPASKVAIHAP